MECMRGMHEGDEDEDVCVVCVHARTHAFLVFRFDSVCMYLYGKYIL